MVSTEDKVLQRAQELGYTPIADTVICAKLTPYNQRTAIERGVDMFKESMKFETPESFFKVLFCTENELVSIPLSWWTGAMKKDAHQAIAFEDITGFQAPEAKAISWQGRLETKNGDYELVIGDETLGKLNLSGGALLKGDWRQNNLPRFVEKLESVVGK